MKSIMISIKPEYVAKILNGEKTIEIRKSCPKCELPCKVYIYCTKCKDTKRYTDEVDIPLTTRKWMGNGKVVAEFTLNKVEEFSVGSLRSDDIEKLACLSHKEMIDYFYKPEELDGNHSKQGYVWHIRDLIIYDKPKLLQEFFKPCDGCEKLGTDRCTNEISYCKAKTIIRPPQSWCYVEEIGEEVEN